MTRIFFMETMQYYSLLLMKKNQLNLICDLLVYLDCNVYAKEDIPEFIGKKNDYHFTCVSTR